MRVLSCRSILARIKRPGFWRNSVGCYAALSRTILAFASAFGANTGANNCDPCRHGRKSKFCVYQCVNGREKEHKFRMVPCYKAGWSQCWATCKNGKNIGVAS